MVLNIQSLVCGWESSVLSALGTVWEEARKKKTDEKKYVFFSAPLRPPPAINTDALPLGIYETKMAARSAKRSILLTKK